MDDGVDLKRIEELQLPEIEDDDDAPTKRRKEKQSEEALREYHF